MGTWGESQNMVQFVCEFTENHIAGEAQNTVGFGKKFTENHFEGEAQIWWSLCVNFRKILCGWSNKIRLSLCQKLTENHFAGV